MQKVSDTWVLLFICLCEGSSNFWNNDFLAEGGFLLFSTTGNFMSLNVGNNFVWVFFNLPMDTFMSFESKWNSRMSALFTLNLSSLPFRRNMDMLWSHCFLLLGFIENEKKRPLYIACFCRHAGKVTNANTVSFCVKYLLLIISPPFAKI